MKNNLIKSVLTVIQIVSIALLISSCKKDGQPVVRYNATFYIGVNSESGESCIYKDGDLLSILEGNSWVNGLAVMSDGIYASGYATSSTNEGERVPAVWKDGIRLDLSFGNAVTGSLEKMVVSGSDWLCSGTLYEAGVPYGVIVRNGQVVYKSESGVKFKDMDCGVSGDCYVLGYNDDGLSLFRIDAKTWKVTFRQLVVAGDENSAWSSCLYVGLYDIAVGLTKTDLKTSRNHAYYWVDGDLIDVKDDSRINDVTFIGGYLVMGGCLETKTSGESSTYRSTAVQWVNNMAQDFSVGCTGNSEVSLVSSWNNMFLFECVTHDGGIQLCSDGALLKEVSFPQKPIVACWNVVVKQI